MVKTIAKKKTEKKSKLTKPAKPNKLSKTSSKKSVKTPAKKTSVKKVVDKKIIKKVSTTATEKPKKDVAKTPIPKKPAPIIKKATPVVKKAAPSTKQEATSVTSANATIVSVTPVQPEVRVKRAYRKSGKKVATSEYISTKFQPSSALKDFVAPTTVFIQNGRRFGDEHRFLTNREPKKIDKISKKYLTKANINFLRSILLEQRKLLLEGLDNSVNDLSDDAVTVADPNDRASQETDLAIELRERDRETKLIRKIDITLGRIDKKDFGYCDTCGVEVGMKRLEARPMASLCIDCKELQEFKEKQTKK